MRGSGSSRSGGAGRWIADVRAVLRRVQRRPLAMALAVATVAIGIGASAALSAVASALLKPPPYSDPERLVEVWNHLVDDPEFGLSALEWRTYRRARSFEDIAVYHTGGANLTAGGTAVRVRRARVSPNFFSVLGSTALEGRPFTSLPRGTPPAVLSAGFRDRHFGGGRAVGGTLTLEGTTYEIVAVMPPSFAFPDRDVEVWVPAAFEAGSGRGNVFLSAVGRLRPDPRIETATAELDRLAAGLKRALPADYRSETGWGAHATRLAGAALARHGPLLVIVGVAVGLVLLASCVNVANLLLIRAERSRGEMAVRQAMGAGVDDLVRLALIEGLVLAIGGGGLGLLLAASGTDLLSALLPATVPASAPMTGSVVAIAVGLVLVSGVFFGAAPALVSARVAPGTALRAGTRSRRSRSPAVLASVQVATAVLLVGASLLLWRTVTELTSVEFGYAIDRTLGFRLSLPATDYATPESRQRLFSSLERRLAALPGVEAVGVTSALPLSDFGGGGGVYIEDVASDSAALTAVQRPVSPGYFEALGVRLVAGREFTPHDREGRPRVAIVDAGFARRTWGQPASAVGRRIRFFFGGDEWNEIVGVVEPVRVAGPADDSSFQVYVPFAQRPTAAAHVAIRMGPGSVGRVVPAIRQELARLDPSLPVYDIATMRDRLAERIARERAAVWIFGAFAAVTLVLCLVGIYGVLGLSIERRTREIGIRIAIGAGPRGVAWLVLRTTAVIVAAGAAVGVCASLGLARLAEGFLFQVGPADPLAHGLALAAIGLVAAAASLRPIGMALAIEPVEALRSE